MALHEQLRGKEEQKPKRIITDNPNLEIVNPKFGKKFSFQMSPNGSVSIGVEELSADTKTNIELEGNFAEIVGNYFFAKLRSIDASRLRGAVESEGPEMEALSYENQLGDAVKIMYKKGTFSKEKIKEIIEDRAKLINLGENHMGITPFDVRTIRDRLNKRVYKYFENADRLKKQKKSK